MPDRRILRGFFLAVAATLLYSTMSVAIRFIYSRGNIDPFSLMAVRAAVAGVMLWILRPRREPIWPEKADLPWLLMAWLGLLASGIAYFFALKTVPAATLVLLSYTYPAFTAIAGHFWLHEPLGARRILALIITFAGSATLLGWSSFGLHAIPIGGLVLALLTGLTYAVYNLGGQQVMRRRSANWTNRWATTGLAVVFLIVRPPHLLIHGGAPLLLGGLYLGLVITLTAGTLFLAAIREIGATRASLYAAVEPLFTALFAWMVLSEGLNWGHLIGGSLVLCGVLWLEGLGSAAVAEAPPG